MFAVKWSMRWEPASRTPVLDQWFLSEPDSHPAVPGALCSFPEQFTPLINCSPQSKKKKGRESRLRPANTSNWESNILTGRLSGTLCLFFACVNVWVFLSVFEVRATHIFNFTNMQIHASEVQSYRQHLNNPVLKHPGKAVPLRFMTEPQARVPLFFSLFITLGK